MQGPKARVLSAVLVLAFAASACSGTAASTATAPPATDPPATSAPTTTAVPTTVPPETTTTSPSTTISLEPVGDPVALQALVEEVAVNSGIPLDEFFVPDITQADPVGATEELIKFSDWAITTKPDKSLVVVHTIEDSPAFFEERSLFDTFESNGWRGATPKAYVIRNLVVIDAETVPMSDSDLAGLPAGAVGLQFFLSVPDGLEVVDDSTGEVVNTIAPYSDQLFFMVIAPTDVGWREYFYVSGSDI